MTYASLSDLQTLTGERELIQLTDRADPPSDNVDVAVVNRALFDADQIINSYGSAQYALPLTTTPPLLSGLACDIARYKLWKDEATDEVRRRYEDALRLLAQISKGLAKLPDVAGIEPASQPAVILTHAPERLFTRDSMRRF